MSKAAVDITDLLLGGTLTPAVAENAVQLYASSPTAQIDGHALAQSYSREILSRPTSKKVNTNYETLASALVDYISQSFITRLDKLTKAGGPRILMMGSNRVCQDHQKYRAVSITNIRKKLPTVVAKIHAGDLTRFVHLITSDHVYGACVLCRQLGSFTLLGTLPGKMRLLMDTTDAPEAGSDMSSFIGHPGSFGAIAGFCWKETCLPNCADCGGMAPIRYDHEWLKSRREDKLCPKCSTKMLINVQRPTFDRRGQRKLQKLIID